MYELCSLCEMYRIQTQGTFNIAAGTLMHAHGFRENTNAIHASALDQLDLDNAIILNELQHTIERTDPRVSIDFGAIAKGFVLDLIKAELTSFGITNAFLHGGTSSILAMGHNHAGLPWTVRISSDHILALSELAAGISETYSQIRDTGNDKHGHVMNPRTRGPASHQVELAACVHASAAAADAYATAACVDPSIANRLSNDSCTLLVFESTTPSTPSFIHDPLRVVQSRGFDHDRS